MQAYYSDFDEEVEIDKLLQIARSTIKSKKAVLPWRQAENAVQPPPTKYNRFKKPETTKSSHSQKL